MQSHGKESAEAFQQANRAGKQLTGFLAPDYRLPTIDCVHRMPCLQRDEGREILPGLRGAGADQRLQRLGQAVDTEVEHRKQAPDHAHRAHVPIGRPLRVEPYAPVEMARDTM